MPFVTECPDHDGCNVIESDGFPDQPGSWRSHFDDDVDPAVRLNPDDPAQAEVEDRRSSTATDVLDRRAPTQDEADRMRGLLSRDGEWRGPVDPAGERVRGGSEVRR